VAFRNSPRFEPKITFRAAQPQTKQNKMSAIALSNDSRLASRITVVLIFWKMSFEKATSGRNRGGVRFGLHAVIESW
jgi:hypothetical protein